MDLYNLQKQAKQIKKELSAIHIEAEVEWVIVTMTAEMVVISIHIPENLMGEGNANRLWIIIVKAIAKAKEKAEQISAEKMKGLMWNMGIPWLWW